jgi:hypothetical protein
LYQYSRRVREVRLISRRRCGLCDKAREVLTGERERTPFHLSEVFIDGDEGLEREYGIRVPVVLIDGREWFEYRVDAISLREALDG